MPRFHVQRQRARPPRRALYRGDRSVRDVHPFDASWGLLLRPDLRATAPR